MWIWKRWEIYGLTCKKLGLPMMLQNHIIEPLDKGGKWYRDHRNFKPKQADAGYWELQNKSRFIKIGSQEAEIALRVGKILIICIIERSILEEVFMSESWINFPVIPRSYYLKLMRKLIIVMKKVKSSIESQNVKFGDLIRSQQQNGSKGWWGKWRPIKD